MELYDMSFLESGRQEPVVKLERDWTEVDEDTEIDDDQTKSAPDEGSFQILQELKHEAGTDDENDTKQRFDNIECHNSQVSSNSEYINVYDDMIDIEDVKFAITEKLGNVGGETSAELNDGRSQASSTDNISPHLLNETYETHIKHELKLHSSYLLTYTVEKRFSCEICEYKCGRKYDLKRHLLTHTGDKPFSCEICEYKCCLKYQLKRHLLTHTDEKLISCDKCDFKCIKKYELKRHLLTHTGEKPLSCDKCIYKCFQKSHLKQHLLTHTGEKPLSCDKCNYKCIQKGSLKQHLLTHTGEKPFSCDKCIYKCFLKSHLKQHLLTHTGEKPFSCDKCIYKCFQKSHLKQHLLKHW